MVDNYYFSKYFPLTYELITQLFIALIISAFTAWVTVNLALKRFKSERIWEKKYSAYYDLLSKLHDERVFFELMLHRIETGKKEIGVNDSELVKNIRKASERICQLRDIGTFLLNEDALNCLSELQRNMQKINSVSDIYQFNRYSEEAIINCINQIQVIAKKDLSIK